MLSGTRDVTSVMVLAQDAARRRSRDLLKMLNTPCKFQVGSSDCEIDFKVIHIIRESKEIKREAILKGTSG